MFCFFFSKCDILSNSFSFFFFFFSMYDILSKLFLFIFVVPNGLIFTVNHLHS